MNGIVMLQSVTPEAWITVLCFVMYFAIPVLMVTNRISPTAALSWMLAIAFYKCIDLGLPDDKGWVDLFQGGLTESEIFGMLFSTAVVMSGLIILGAFLIRNLGHFLDRDDQPDKPEAGHIAKVIQFPAKAKDSTS